MDKATAQELANMSKRIFKLEKQLSDFAEMLNERQQGDIDYLAMELDIDLDQYEEEPFEEVE